MFQSPRPRRSIVLSLLLLLVCLPLTSRAAVTPDQVAKAIEDAKTFLYSIQNEDGNWDDASKRFEQPHYGGWTAIATYALLAGGEKPTAEKLQKPIEFLKQVDMKSIYGLGMRAQVWTFLPKSDDLDKYIKRDAELLLQKGFDDKTGLYGYTTARDSEHNSPSQYGVLGVWALEQAGIEVSPKYWELVEKTWKKNQGVDGSWQYGATPPDPGKGSPAFTAAGIATLFITQDYLHSGEGSKCSGNLDNANIEAGLKWMSKHFAAVGGDGYALYGVERIGVASGLKYFGETDWYQTGAEVLVKSQANGSWGTHGPVPGTSWGILFLSRGRAPIVMNKLQYNISPLGGGSRAPKDKELKEGNWNERPRDCANVTRWISKQAERDLNWQIVNLKAPVDELHDAPILYISGNQAVSFSEEEEKKLKQFVEQGGIILANADCGGASFAGSIKKLGEKLFPPYKFAPLPQKHVINTDQRFPLTKMKQKPEINSLSNGARELIILIPGNDPAKAWQMNQPAGPQESLFQLADNIYEYAVDKGSARFKGETYIVNRDEKLKADRTLKLARLQYDGNWNPEPGGWRRLANLLHNEHKFDVTVDTIKLGTGKLSATSHKIAHLTGTEKITLTEAQRSEIKSFVDGGGTLIVDSAGGDSDFAQAVEGEIGTIFGGAAKDLPILKFDHPVFNLQQAPIKEVTYRGYAKRNIGNSKTPLLRGIDMNGRTAIFFSREDLSVGLVGHAVDGINGYSPRSATEIVENIILYAAGKSPTTGPSSGPTAAAKPAGESATSKPVATTAPKPAAAASDESPK